MKTPVIAIGLDAAEPKLMEAWMAQGLLPNLNRVRQQGIYGRLHNSIDYQDGTTEFSSTEALWVTAATGCLPNKTGFWDAAIYDPKTYAVNIDPVYGGYDYQEYKPFYALGENYKVAAFDVPVTRVVPNVRGTQITGWGGHHPFYPSESQPAGLLSELETKYGKNPVYQLDNGVWWDREYFKWVTESVKHSVETRAQICCELLQQDDWDLAIFGFGEIHTLGHDLYHRSQPDHPLYEYINQVDPVGDPLLAGFQQVDRAVGQIIDRSPATATIVLFSAHGMGANVTDLLSMVFMAEVLYRYNFPGQVALQSGDITQAAPPTITKNIRNGWAADIWGLVDEPNPIKKLWHTWTHKKFLLGDKHGLHSPHRLMAEGSSLGWMPSMWYRPLWPQMKAFALPAFSDGYIRINVQGRERDGIVAPAEYDAVCAEIAAMLYLLQDGRTKQPLVKQVVRTRTSPFDDDAKLPEPDLIVVWHEIPTDVVDHPDLGRIGPLTFNRSGSHRENGFLMASGPGITPGSDLTAGGAVDIAPTILNLMGAEIPAYFDGKPLLQPAVVLS
jgi:predicted AlkP superfamily phosphohydrolase/phosphomutase